MVVVVKSHYTSFFGTGERRKGEFPSLV